MKKKAVKIAIIGFGNIGRAVARNLKKNAALISERVGSPVRLKAVFDKSASALRAARAQGVSTCGSLSDILRDPEIDIVVEAMGGENPARKVIMRSMAAGKSVVTSNKEVVAKNLRRMLAASRKNNVSLLFEAAVGGGTPVIAAIRDELAGNVIGLLYGIVNGTTNYVLTRMTESGSEFKEALRDAIRHGFAEANPRMDIEGHDSAYKTAILASVAFSADVKVKDVYVEGISRIAQEDIRYSDEIGYVIKLIAVARVAHGQLEVRVHPMLISKNHRLASVNGSLNAVYVKGSPLGWVLLSARGAGGDPTSSAVLADIVNASRRIVNGDMPVSWSIPEKIKIRKMGNVESRYYIRLKAPDRSGVLAGISKAFAAARVSIQAVVQKETVGSAATIVILTHNVLEKNLMKAISYIKKLSVVREVCNVIRVASE